jgi:hypothetical protein
MVDRSARTKGAPLCPGQIRPVHGLGEMQVGVDADNGRIHHEQLNADKGRANENIDYQALGQYSHRNKLPRVRSEWHWHS